MIDGQTLNYPAITVAALPESMAALYGERAAIIEGDNTLTFADLADRSQAIAAGLIAAGVGPGDVVAIHLPNSGEFFVLYFATMRSGAAVTLINPLQPESGLRDQLNDSGASVVFTTADGASTVIAAASADVGRIVTIDETDARAGEDPRVVSLAEFAVHGGRLREPAITGEDVAHLAFTGGTTGRSKAVEVRHRNVVANITQLVAWRAGHSLSFDGRLALSPRAGRGRHTVNPGDAVTVLVSPLYHAHALINSCFLLLCGCTHVLAGRFDAGRMLGLIERYRATYVTGSPAMWNALALHPDAAVRDTGSVRVLSSGAAPLDRSTIDAMTEVFPGAIIAEGYGLTEATCVVASTPLVEGLEYRVGSIGVPLIDTTVELRTEDGSALVPDGEPGIMWVRGPQVAAGYFHEPELTARQFVDGWLDTGDIALRDQDGYLFIRGRAKEMLIYKGYNVYPREIEEVLLGHPAVGAVAVVGRDAAEVGQEPVAFVVPATDELIDAAELMAYVAERVLPYKKIREVVVVDSLPTTAAGKILKRTLQEQLVAGDSPRT